ncbi:MAG: hypothetical protein JSU73_10145 [candidate division WOR-3 bacterium]|nr:MAG: hypothetical protein JSU73_10145 [candidate division WOR-3 bacterium]
MKSWVLVPVCLPFLRLCAWPVTTPCTIERLANGNSLLTDAGSFSDNNGRVFEVDSLGRTVWAYLRNDIPWVHSGRLTPTGTILITATSNSRVLEIDRDWNVVWSKSTGLNYPNDACRLPGNRTLITDRDNDRVVEVDSAGNVVWSYAQLLRPHNASRLANGHTLVCDSDRDRVVEVDSAGNAVWSFSQGLSWPRCAQRLANGNTIVADSRNRRLLEVDSSGSTVWEYRLYGLSYSVVRLDNGNTLFGAGRFAELTPDRTVVWQYPHTVSVLVDTIWVANPTSGCSLYVHIHRPEYAGSQNPVPGVVLIPDGNGAGTGYDSTGYADWLAEDGFAVLHFDPDGRGRSQPYPENYNGHVHQDGLRECFKTLASQDYVDPDDCGMFSKSYGITMASGAIARHQTRPEVRFLLDFEGPSDRYQTCQDSGGHIPVPVDSQPFWVEREAARFMKKVRCPYLRLQTRTDHNPRIRDNGHAVALIDSATNTAHGGSGISVWTRVNDSVMNEPNQVYTLQDPPVWVSEDQSVHQQVREALYLRELGRMDYTGQHKQKPARPSTELRLEANPVRAGARVRAFASSPVQVGVWDCSGTFVAACRVQGRTAVWDSEGAVSGCYWLRPLGGGPGVKLVLSR